MSWVETLAKKARKTPQTTRMQTLLEVYDLNEYDPKNQKDFLGLPAVSPGELQDLLHCEIVRVVATPEPTRNDSELESASGFTSCLESITRF